MSPSRLPAAAIMAALLALAGCARPDAPVTTTEFVAKPVPRPPLRLPEVDRFTAREWSVTVVTRENAASVFARMEEEGLHPVLFAVDAGGYRDLTLDMEDLVRVVRQQRLKIEALEDYYMDGDGTVSADDLLGTHLHDE